MSMNHIPGNAQINYSFILSLTHDELLKIAISRSRLLRSLLPTLYILSNILSRWSPYIHQLWEGGASGPTISCIRQYIRYSYTDSRRNIVEYSVWGHTCNLVKSAHIYTKIPIQNGIEQDDPSPLLFKILGWILKRWTGLAQDTNRCRVQAFPGHS